MIVYTREAVVVIVEIVYELSCIILENNGSNSRDLKLILIRG